MKKVVLVLLGLLILGTISQAAVVGVTGPKFSSQEYFGAAKKIYPSGISWTIGLTYKMGDYLTFTIPSVMTFAAPTTGTGWYLCTTVGAAYSNDINGSGVPEWTLFSGGTGTSSIMFRVADVPAGATFNAGTRWYLSTVVGGAAVPTGSIPITAPQGLAASSVASGGTTYKIAIGAVDGISGLGFDPGDVASKTFLTNTYQLLAAYPDVARVIDVALLRKRFVSGTTGTVTAAGTFDLTNTVPADYFATFTADDKFVHSVAGDMTGVSYLRFISDTNHPSSATAATVTNLGSLTFGLGLDARIVVDGTTILENRTFTDTLVFEPHSGSWWGRTLANGVEYQNWSHNGSIFRSVWFTTATLAGNYSAFRFANTSTVAGDVYAVVILDDGQEAGTVVPFNAGTVPAKGHLSITGLDLVKKAGLIPDTTGATQGWKGRVYFTVLVPNTYCYGTELHQAGSLGYTEINMDRSFISWQK